MITDGLLSYIQTQLEKDTPLDLISSHLVEAGWLVSDIEQGFNTVAAIIAREEQQRKKEIEESIRAQEKAQEEPQSQSAGPDLYRELPEVAPVDQRPRPMKTPLSSTPSSAETFEPKVWMPKTVVATSVTTPNSVLVPVENKAPVVSTLVQTPSSVQTPPQEKPIATKEEPSGHLTPSIPKISSTPALDQIKNTTPVTPSPVTTQPAKPTSSTLSQTPAPQKPVAPLLELKKEAIDIVPHDAMIHSYTEDISSASKLQYVTPITQKTKPKQIVESKIKPKTIVVIGISLLFVAGVVAAFAGGYIKLPAVVRKDPSNVVFSATINFDSLKSYKTETLATVTMPSIANITAGLVSGQVVHSKDTESIVLQAHGRVTNKILKSPTIVDYDGTIKSTLLKDDIVTNVAYDGSTMYILVPILTQLFGAYAPQNVTVAVRDGEFANIIPELPQNIQDFIKRVDVHNILSKGVPLFAVDQVENAITQYMKKINVTRTNDEDIKGVSTYHYQITADHQATKDLLTKMASAFIGKLSADQQKNVDSLIGAINMDSLDMWIGKNDNMIHQYELSLTAPLSKVLALDDSGIAGNQVQLTWKRTYYDFDIPNNIQFTSNTVTTADFIHSIEDAKIKNSVASFSPLAKSLSNAEGSFGKVANMGGSCTAPASGSLFSPTGHAKGAIGPIALIATAMQTVLGISNNTGSCYSTPAAWAFAVPLSSNPQSNFCADSTGALTTLSTPLKGVICK